MLNVSDGKGNIGGICNVFIHAVRLKYLRIAHGYVMHFNARRVQSYIFSKSYKQ